MSTPANSETAGYSGTPLIRKLGIKHDSTVVLLGAPDGFDRTLGELPAAAKLRRINSGYRDLTIWFVRSRAELRRKLPAILRSLRDSGLWVAWPKKASPIESDLTEDILREEILPTGYVDHKVCAIDDDWSGLRFAKRRS